MLNEIREYIKYKSYFQLKYEDSDIVIYCNKYNDNDDMVDKSHAESLRDNLLGFYPRLNIIVDVYEKKSSLIIKK